MHTFNAYVTFEIRAGVLYQHLKLEAQPKVLDADKARSVSILNGLKNDSCRKNFEKTRS